MPDTKTVKVAIDPNMIIDLPALRAEILAAFPPATVNLQHGKYRNDNGITTTLQERLVIVSGVHALYTNQAVIDKVLAHVALDDNYGDE